MLNFVAMKTFKYQQVNMKTHKYKLEFFTVFSVLDSCFPCKVAETKHSHPALPDAVYQQAEYSKAECFV